MNSDQSSINSITKLFEDEKQKEFISEFAKHFNNISEKLYFNQIQMNIGHRLRPRLVYWGYMINNAASDVSKENISMLADIAASIEFLHKSSIILDDLIDNDSERHGEPAFHTIYGSENTVLFTLNILSVSMMNLNNIFSQNSISHTIYGKSMGVLINTMYKMTLGCLQEQNLSENTIENIEYIKDIIQKETSSLITNSLLIGYYAGGKYDDCQEEILNEIGYNCGYCFQAMNDLEPFSDTLKITEHKGNAETDIIYNKKNIAYAVLMNTISIFEKKKLEKSGEEKIRYINKLMTKYEIQRVLLEEIDNVHNKINNDIKKLGNLCSNPSWGINFQTFVDSLFSVCKNRL